MRAPVFYQGVGMIRNDNAQGEYYVTDMVRLLSGIRDSKGGPRYRVSRRAGGPSGVGAGLQFARRAAGDPGLRAAETAATAGDGRSRRPAATQAGAVRHGAPVASEDRGRAGRRCSDGCAKSTARTTTFTSRSARILPAYCSATENDSAWTRRCVSSVHRGGST